MRGGEEAAPFPLLLFRLTQQTWGEDFHMRREMILKSRELEAQGDSGLSFLRHVTWDTP